jgi:hypothetical protein
VLAQPHFGFAIPLQPKRVSLDSSTCTRF